MASGNLLTLVLMHLGSVLNRCMSFEPPYISVCGVSILVMVVLTLGCNVLTLVAVTRFISMLLKWLSISFGRLLDLLKINWQRGELRRCVCSVSVVDRCLVMRWWLTVWFGLWVRTCVVTSVPGPMQLMLSGCLWLLMMSMRRLGAKFDRGAPVMLILPENIYRRLL